MIPASNAIPQNKRIPKEHGEDENPLDIYSL
jgi:hypothetical protein